MAARTILQTNTLEEFRVQFNALSSQDFGDIGTLDSSISATSIIGAMNELVSIVGANEGFFIEDETSSQQLIGAGQRLKVFGTSGETTAIVSASDTLTIGLAPDLNVNSLTTTAGITANGGTSTLGTIQISGNIISSTDSSEINFDSRLNATSFFTNTGLGQFFEQGGFPRIESNQTGGSGTFGNNLLIVDANLFMNQTHGIVFEGDTADANTTTLTVADPSGTNLITIPDETGTLVSIVSTDVIGQDQLKSVVTLQIKDSTGAVLKTLYGAGS